MLSRAVRSSEADTEATDVIEHRPDQNAIQTGLTLNAPSPEAGLGGWLFGFAILPVFRRF